MLTANNTVFCQSLSSLSLEFNQESLYDTPLYLSVEFSSNPRELCISTAQALSQPQLHNYCLHERERERNSHGAVLWPPPPLTNQQVKRLMLHWSQWSCQRHHHLRPDRLALATRAVGDSTLSTEGFTDLVGSPLSSHTPQLPPPPPGLCILIRIFLFLF